MEANGHIGDGVQKVCVPFSKEVPLRIHTFYCNGHGCVSLMYQGIIGRDILQGFCPGCVLGVRDVRHWRYFLLV